jgi:hypothetical protein
MVWDFFSFLFLMPLVSGPRLKVCYLGFLEVTRWTSSPLPIICLRPFTFFFHSSTSAAWWDLPFLCQITSLVDEIYLFAPCFASWSSIICSKLHLIGLIFSHIILSLDLFELPWPLTDNGLARLEVSVENIQFARLPFMLNVPPPNFDCYLCNGGDFRPRSIRQRDYVLVCGRCEAKPRRTLVGGAFHT